MEKGNDFWAFGPGETPVKIMKQFAAQMSRKAKKEKREKKERDAAADRPIADQIDELVDNLVRTDDSERRRFLNRIRWIPVADSVLERIAETAIDRLKCVRCGDSMRGLVSTLVGIGPRILPVVGRSWKSAPNELQAAGVATAIGLLVGKMDPGQLHCALGLVRRAGVRLGTADHRRCEAVKRVEFQILQALQASQSGT